MKEKKEARLMGTSWPFAVISVLCFLSVISTNVNGVRADSSPPQGIAGCLSGFGEFIRDSTYIPTVKIQSSYFNESDRAGDDYVIYPHNLGQDFPTIMIMNLKTGLITTIRQKAFKSKDCKFYACTDTGSENRPTDVFKLKCRENTGNQNQGPASVPDASSDSQVNDWVDRVACGQDPDKGVSKAPSSGFQYLTENNESSTNKFLTYLNVNASPSNSPDSTKKMIDLYQMCLPFLSGAVSEAFTTRIKNLQRSLNPRQESNSTQSKTPSEVVF